MVIREYLVLALNAVFRIGIGLICLKVIALYGTSADLLHYGQVQSILNIMVTLGQLGIGYGLLTLFKGKKSDARSILPAISLGFAATTLLCYIVFTSVTQYFGIPKSPPTDSIAFLFAILGSVLVSVIHSYYIGTGQPAHANLLQTTVYMGAILVIALAIKIDIFLVNIAVGSASFIFSSIFLYRPVKDYLQSKSLVQALKIFILEMRGVQLFSLYTLISVLVAQGTLFYSRAILLGDENTSEGATWQLFVSLMLALNTAYSVYLGSYYLSEITSASSSLQKSMRLTVIALAVFTAVFAVCNLFGDLVVRAFLSQQYEFHMFLNLVIFSELLKIISLPFVYYLIAKKRVYSLVIIEVGACVGFMMGNLVAHGQGPTSVSVGLVSGSIIALVLGATLFVISLNEVSK
jgi:hypothetical protein